MISGYASVFYAGTPETQYALGHNYVERILPGAFRSTIERDDVVALFNHDSNLILGRASAGSLSLREDEKGLWYSVTESPTSIYRDVAELQSRNEVMGSSFGFIVTDEQQRRDGELLVREITEVQLLDVGPVTFPAYQGTNQVRFVSREGRCLPVEGQAATEARDAFTLVRKPLPFSDRLLNKEHPDRWNT